MLPCVCSVIDHRWRQNVVRTKKWHTRRSRVCHWCLSCGLKQFSCVQKFQCASITWWMYANHEPTKLLLRGYSIKEWQNSYVSDTVECTCKGWSFHVLVQASIVKKMIAINTFNKFLVAGIRDNVLKFKRSIKRKLTLGLPVSRLHY